MNLEDYEDYEDDQHAKARESKVKRRSIDKMMRGNRSVFAMRDAQRKRDEKRIKGHAED